MPPTAATLSHQSTQCRGSPDPACGSSSSCWLPALPAPCGVQEGHGTAPVLPAPNPTVSVPKRCCNKSLQTQRLQTTQIHSPKSSGGRTPKWVLQSKTKGSAQLVPPGSSSGEPIHLLAFLPSAFFNSQIFPPCPKPALVRSSHLH